MGDAAHGAGLTTASAASTALRLPGACRGAQQKPHFNFFAITSVA